MFLMQRKFVRNDKSDCGQQNNDNEVIHKVRFFLTHFFVLFIKNILRKSDVVYIFITISLKDKLKMNIQTDKIILLVGLMGSGKTSVGRRLAQRLNLPFVDGDQEVEKAAGLSLVDVLKCFGPEEYRAGEARVMKRLLQGAPCVLASGGGSFVCDQTRKLARERAVTIWLKADVDVLCTRTAGRQRRPFLQGDDAELREKIENYVSEEYPYYSEADIVVETKEERVSDTVNRVLMSLESFLKQI